MDFVFFDIECACVSKTCAKICAFGYCITDEKLNIKEKKDLLINPQGGFHLTDRKGEKGLVLPYDYSEFKQHPVFPEVYPFIKKLLTEGNIVVGHSIMNDVKYLNLETARFSLPSLDFSFYDTQFIYMNKTDVFDRQLALGTIAEALGVEFVAHRAADDAYATMRTAKAMCEAENKDLLTLVNDYGIRAGFTKNGEATDCTSDKREEFLRLARERKEERERKRELFVNVVCGKRPKKISTNLKGKIFSFARGIEESPDRSLGYIKTIYENGGNYSFRAEKCNVYVATETDNSLRKKNAVSSGAEILTENEFQELLSL